MPPMRPLAYDVTRLFLGPLSRAPRGIDRVDLILARHFFAESDRETWGLLPTPWGMRLFDAARVQRGLLRLEQIWHEDVEDIAHDPFYGLLRDRLLGRHGGPHPNMDRFGLAQKGARMLHLLGGTGIVLGRPVRDLAKNSAYLNIGQLTPGAPILFNWLERRPDVSTILMLHDVIPIEHPDLVEPGSVRFHRTVLNTAARHSDGLIVTTQYANHTVARELARVGRSSVRMLSAMLPLHQAFDTPAQPDRELEGVEYFIAVGAIEKRKNLLLLAEVWEALLAKLGPDTPQLVISGSPHFGATEIKARFASSPARKQVKMISRISTAGIKSLISGAKALLMPSYAEGFGLPIVEARVLGCPVIASDIPAHREVVRGDALLLPVDDPAAWAEAVSRHVGAPRTSHVDTAGVSASRGQFVEMIETFLDEMA